MSDCKCPSPCNPCNNCPDDEEALEVEILDADECSGSCGGCCWNKCNDNKWINIQSTNDCLTVDTSECGVIKLTAECPKPTYVKAWDNVTVREVTPPSDCYIDGWDCDIKGWREVSATDEKVKACSWDSTPWYLNQKLQAWSWIIIDSVGCDGTNSKVKISIDENIFPECPEPPELEIRNRSSVINVSQMWDYKHIVVIEDNDKWGFYNNTVMLWFLSTKYYNNIPLNSDWNAAYVSWIATDDAWWGWDMCTGNTDLATKNGIRIKQDWYYYVYWQITVCLNWKDANRYANLWRALIRVSDTNRTFLWNTFSLGTAKHWAYWTFIAAKNWNWITVAQDWTISVNRWTVNVWEGGWTYEVSFQNTGWMQPTGWFDGPWATLNVWILVDLKAWELITLGYRCQSDIPEAAGKSTTFEIVWVNDSSTEFKSVFWWTTLWVIPISPTRFQRNTESEIFEAIRKES